MHVLFKKQKFIKPSFRTYRFLGSQPNLSLKIAYKYLYCIMNRERLSCSYMADVYNKCQCIAGSYSSSTKAPSYFYSTVYIGSHSKLSCCIKACYWSLLHWCQVFLMLYLLTNSRHGGGNISSNEITDKLFLQEVGCLIINGCLFNESLYVLKILSFLFT